MVGINDILAEQQKLLEVIEAQDAKINPALERLSANGSREQSALFAAACAERAVGILFWVAANEGRQADLDFYRKALEQVWGQPVEGDRDRVSPDDVYARHDLARGPESDGGRAGGLAQTAALALRSVLAYGQTGDFAHIRQVAAQLRNDASGLAHRTSTDGLATVEIDRQVSEIETILRDGATTDLAARLREQAQAVGREWLDLAVRYYRTGH
ncbi:hypothetical protein KGQ19_18820 [Catenulispora sp. NL8]|uniref:Uncharacterized protein n=1 Tax=Catenulispora pinistramenti TaxID=2705254 RepID=A0ABS5KSA1_9ACTN|nr:hypothetical protein [Catenulispora pinistramenti]MBS2548922.1 hypothetical protein [Catenulispora pinistramenti]